MIKTAHELCMSAMEKFGKNDKEGGYADLEEALMLAPDHIYYLEEMAEHKYYDDEFDKSVEITVHQIDILMKQLIEAHARLAILYIHTRRKDLALKERSWLIEHNPTSFDYFYRASLLEENGNIEAALSDYNEAVRFDTDNRDARFKRAHIHFEFGNYQLVVDDMDYVISREPLPLVKANLHYWRGKAHYMLGEKEKALTDFNTARQLRNEPAFEDADIAFQQLKY